MVSDEGKMIIGQPTGGVDPRGPAVSVTHLSRRFSGARGLHWRQRRSQEVSALSEVTLDIRRGEVFGLVGPNGAGKTTFIKVLSTLLTPSGGRAAVLGYDVVTEFREIRKSINFVFGGERGLYWRLSCLDNMRYFADLYRIPRSVSTERVEQLIRLVGLWERRFDRVESFSKGMKQRLHLAKALINGPAVLFLDEPTIGLDPTAAHLVRDIVEHIKSTGTTVLLTSHYMLEMEELSDRIGVLNNGRLQTVLAPGELARSATGLNVLEIRGRPGLYLEEARLAALSSRYVVRVTPLGQMQLVRVLADDVQRAAPEIAATLRVPRAEIAERPATIEDAYHAMLAQC